MKETLFSQHDVAAAHHTRFIQREYSGNVKAAWQELVNENPASNNTLERWQQDYAHGLTVLRSAKLISTERLAAGTAAPATFASQIDSPAVAFSAGYMGTQAVQRYWGLVRSLNAE